jgi:hypothetical protein
MLNNIMSIKILGAVDKLISNDERVIQLSGDMDGIIASFYDKNNNPSLFLDGTSARLGNVGIKTNVPNEALTVVGNISATGNLNASTLYGNGSALYIGSNLIPTTSAFYIGDPSNPVGGIYLAANTLYIASNVTGLSGLELSNVDNIFTVTKGGLRSSVIYTGGLLLSGNNIGADPLVGSLPMTIGTNGLPAVEFLVPIKLQSTTGTPNISGNASFTGSLSANSLVLSDGLLAHNTTIIGTISATGLISQQKNYCVAALYSNQAMTSNDATIQFTDKDDPNNWWNASTYRFQPTVAGYYNIMVMVNWIGANHEVQVNDQIRKNGNTIALVQMPIPKSQTHSVFLQAITYMNGSSDYVDVSGYTGANTSITGETGGNWTKFEAFKIS